MCNRARPDTQLTMPFLCTSVKRLDEDDGHFLLIMIKNLQEKWHDKLTLRIKYITMADWYTDADFVVHADIKSHTRGLLNMGEGEI